MAARDNLGGASNAPQLANQPQNQKEQQPAQPASGYSDVPPAPPPSPQPPAVPEERPSADIPVQQVPGDGRSFPKLPLKPILLGLVGLVLLGLLFFLVRRFLLPGTRTPEQITLTYWGLWEDSPVIEGAIRQFEEENPGVKISYVKQAKEDYRERLVNSLARGAGPDIFRFHNTWVPMLATELSPLPAEVMDAGTYQQTFYPVASQTLRSGANLVGIPLMYDGLGLYINEEIFSSAGKTPPKTWEEFRQLASELTIKNAEGEILQAGAAVGRTENVDHWQDILSLMMLQNGVDLKNPTGEAAEGALKFFTVFATGDRIWDETLPFSTNAFAAGKLAMYFGPSWRAFEIKEQNPALKFKVVPVPQLPKTTSGEPDITWASFWAEGVWSRSKNAQAAWQFLRLLSTKSVLQDMYQEASKTRLFGEPYPRPDMASLLSQDPVVGAYVGGAQDARSWYLTSRTFDGPTGINSRISAYFKDAVNAVVVDRERAENVLPTLAAGVSQVLSDYIVD